MEIRTGKTKVFGQLEQIADGLTDVEEYVYNGGNLKPASETTTSTGPVISTAHDRVFYVPEEDWEKRLDEVDNVNPNSNVHHGSDNYVFVNGEIRLIDEEESHTGPVIETSHDKI